MQNLRLLSIRNIVIEGDFRKLTSQLIWLKWKQCSLDSLPVELKMKNMAVLEMPQSSIKQVWNNQFLAKVPKNLKVLNLSQCYQLEKLPDFSKPQSLVKLDLQGCTSITTLPKSIGCLEKLEFMDLSNCQNLRELPHSFSGLVSLKKLNLSHCTSLTVLPDTLGNLTSIRELVLISTSIVEMPDFFAGMSLSEKLSTSNSPALKRLPNSLGMLHSLRILDMDLSGFVSLPEEIGELLQLEELNLSSCHKLLQLPESLGNPESLRILRINGNSKLTGLPENLSSLRALQVFKASSCGLKTLPAQFALLMSLEFVHLQYNYFCTLPMNFKDLHKLTKLTLHDCKELLELPFLPGSLVYVDISNCKRLRRVSDFSKMKCLETLVLHNCEELECVPGLGSLHALVDLNITRCKNIKSTHIKGLDLLKSLERLHLGGTSVLVSNFREWVKGQRLSSLQAARVVIENARMRWNLKECFEPETVLFGQIEATADKSTINMNSMLLDGRDPEAIDGAVGRNKSREVDICVGNRWLQWRRPLADGRSVLLLELGVKAIKSSTADVDVKTLSINSIWEHARGLSNNQA